jgi:hypothetical protein
MKALITVFVSLLLGFVGLLAVLLCTIFLVSLISIMSIFHVFAFIIIILGGIVCIEFSYRGLKTVFKKN